MGYYDGINCDYYYKAKDQFPPLPPKKIKTLDKSKNCDIIKKKTKENKK